MEKIVTITASANTGIGLWTSICVAFCSLLGRESNHFKAKQDRILRMANTRLNKLAETLKAKCITDYRVTWSGSLSVTVSALAQVEVRTCPKCGKEIKNNATFCGNCGEKLN